MNVQRNGQKHKMTCKALRNEIHTNNSALTIPNFTTGQQRYYVGQRELQGMVLWQLTI
jgi:hypothetical protein